MRTPSERISRAKWRNRTRGLEKIAVVNVLTNGEGTCRHCGHGDIDVLCLDHIDDDGGTRRRLQDKGDNLYHRLIMSGYADEGRLQVLCSNCNVKKEVTRRFTGRVYA